MKFPAFLKKGDKIVLTALSNGVRKNDVNRINKFNKAKENLEQEGFVVEMQDHCLKYRMYKSASGKVRGHKFNEAYLDKDSKMVLNVAGGDFEFESVPYINYKKIKESEPKWVQGYSDSTHITFLMTTLCDVASSYSIGLSEYGTHFFSEQARNNLDLLEGKKMIQHNYEMCNQVNRDDEDIYAMPVYDTKVEWKALKNEEEINISGRLIGGCQDVINTIVGTKYDKVRKFIHKYKDDGIIWYLETFSATPASFMISLNQLKEAGYFKYCKGIVFGRPLFYNTEYIDISYEKAIKSVLGKLNIPIIYNADIGHVKPMITLINGSITTFKYKKGKCEIITELR